MTIYTVYFTPSNNQRSLLSSSWNQYIESNLLVDGVFHLLPHLDDDQGSLYKIKYALKRFIFDMKDPRIIFDAETNQTLSLIKNSSFNAYGEAGLEHFKNSLKNNSRQINIDTVVNYDKSKVAEEYIDIRKILKEPLTLSFPELPERIESTKKDFGIRMYSVKDGKLSLDLNILHAFLSIDSWLDDYHTYLTTKANLAACQAAVEIVLAKAKSGQYPDKMPERVPVDPFIGKAFEYQKMGLGFSVYSTQRDPITYKVREWNVSEK